MQKCCRIWIIGNIRGNLHKRIIAETNHETFLCVQKCSKMMTMMKMQPWAIARGSIDILASVSGSAASPSYFILYTSYFILYTPSYFLYFILATLYFIRHIPSKIVTQQKSHFQKPFRLLWFEIGRYGRSDRMRFEVIIYKKIIFVVWGIRNKRYFCYILICVFLCCVQLVIKKIYFCGKKKTV